MKEKTKVKVILTMPRCGTHFFWSRFVSSENYQLIYDADRLPALSVLADNCKEKLDFLYPSFINPNYNFQYNSLIEVNESLTATQHLQKLSEKYSARPGFELFEKIMSLQDSDNKCLFSVNRFIYTCAYGPYEPALFKDFLWTIEHATQSLKLLCEWFRRAGYAPDYVMIIRKIPEWIRSELLTMPTSKDSKNIVIQRLNNFSLLLKTCQALNIPICWMSDIINGINKNSLDFETSLAPLENYEIEAINDNREEYIAMAKEFTKIKLIRWKKLIQYITESDSIKRISLVRSIGKRPDRIGKILFLSKQIKKDLNGVILNNAKIITPGKPI